MARVICDDIEACTDCLMAIANDDYTGMDDETEVRVRAALESWSKQGYLVPACDEDCEGGFSWSSCDICESGLGGDRHKVALLGDGDEDDAEVQD